MPATTDQIVVLIYDAIEDLTGTRPRNTDPGAAVVAIALPDVKQRKVMIERVIRALYAPTPVVPSDAFVNNLVRSSLLSVAQIASRIAKGHAEERLTGPDAEDGGAPSTAPHFEMGRAPPPPLPRKPAPRAAAPKAAAFPKARPAAWAVTAPSPRPAPRPSLKAAVSPARAPDVGFSQVKIFYATDRAKLTTKPGKVIDYGAKRADGLQLGECEVSIPARHKTGSVERPKWWNFEFAEDPEKHVTLRTVTELGDDAFYKRASEVVAKSQGKEAFVFVHGYKVTFANAARQTAQMAFDLKFDGAPILYSWPSQGKLKDYIVDANTVLLAGRHLIDFLTDVATRTGATRVHVIAHSMGNRAVCDALDALSQRATPMPNLHHVVLTAPDVDVDYFRALVSKFKTVSKSVTLYASSKDKAIQASKMVNGAPRAGEPIVILPGIDSIDASNVETDFLAHGYFSGTRSVLSDIYNLLRDQPAKSRFDLIPSKHADGDYFSFKP